MSRVVLGELVDYLSWLLSRLASPKRRLPGQDANGIVMEPSEDEKLLLIRFVTHDDIEVQTALNIGDLFGEGPGYLDTMMGDMIDGIDAKRKERMDNPITVFPNMTAAAQAVGKVLH